MTMSGYEAVLKAAAEPARARILKLLGRRELDVSGIMAALKMGQSTVSGHLAVLKEAGLVQDRRQGRNIFYSLADRRHNPYAPGLLALMTGWLEDDSQVRGDRRRLAAIDKGDGDGV